MNPKAKIEYYVSDKDGKVLDHVAAPDQASKLIWETDKVYETLKRLQQVQDRVSNNKKARNADIKIVARFPAEVLVGLMKIEPDLLKDKKSFWRILNKYPIYKAYTREGIQGAV